ncbi:MAG: cation-transporting P-type ATPase [Acidimicrobiales bacterium]|nr:cation-transporting P-type ATPase [Acidimicrobiales bacterium]
MSATGLTATDARSRLERDGPNRLPEPPRRSALRRFADQLTHFFALMLWVAGGLAFVAGLPELGIAIFLVVVLNAAFAFAQQTRADRAAERVRALLPCRAVVRRDGRPTTIDAEEVVVGDLLVLEPGDRIPADAVLRRASRLLVDTSTFTGESVPTERQDGPILAGTFVVEGEADAEVTAIGGATRLAEVARLSTATTSPASPLVGELHRVVRTIATIAIAVGGAFFLLTLLLGRDLTDGFLFAVGVTVALVPEALLPTVTLSLAWGAEQLAHRNVLVRELEAVETLGSTTFICTDKTGTLTRNEMAVVEAWTPSGRARTPGGGLEPDLPVEVVEPTAEASIRRAALAAARCSTGHAQLEAGTWTAHGDPMEVALDVFARRMGVDTDADRRDRPVRARHPFDPRRRRMSVVSGDELLVKGAPDSVLGRCRSHEGAEEVLAGFTARGLRVLAVAAGAAPEGPAADPDDVERDLDLLALLALEDPPRDDVAEAIDRCRRAGIRVAMVTGDHPATAAAIGAEVGLRRSDDPVVVGADLPSDDGELAELVDHDGIVVARVAPEDKLRIAVALRARGHVVAMTGDGVNDAPALHEADIGVAMGRSGTDVAREAADMVLLDDHFATIVAGIEQGRATYVNIRRFLTYHLTDNVAELTPFAVWALSGGRFPLALGVLQILALDLGTDTLSAVALGAEPPSPRALDEPPVSGRLLDRLVARRAFAVLGPTVAAATMAAFVVAMVGDGWRPGDPYPTGHALAAASGAAFMAVVIAQTANAFACRSTVRWPGALGWTTNRLLIPAAAAELAFSLLVLLVAPIADELGHAPPPAAGWAVAVAGAGAVLAVDALDKARRRQRAP